MKEHIERETTWDHMKTHEHAQCGCEHRLDGHKPGCEFTSVTGGLDEQKYRCHCPQPWAPDDIEMREQHMRRHWVFPNIKLHVIDYETDQRMVWLPGVWTDTEPEAVIAEWDKRIGAENYYDHAEFVKFQTGWVFKWRARAMWGYVVFEPQDPGDSNIPWGDKNATIVRAE